MKKLLTLAAFLFGIMTLTFAQDAAVAAVAKDTAWNHGGVFTLGITNTGYSNYWQAGGIPSIQWAARINAFSNYKEGKHSWQNSLATGYGQIRQGKGDNASFVKNEDRIELDSKYGYKIANKLYLSGLLNFRTQFFDGFRFDADSNKVTSQLISKAFNPAYLNFGIGLDYQPNDDFSIFYSPLNAKLTIATDENLRPIYIPADITTNAVRFELGSLLRAAYKRAITDNILFQTKASFFANYLDNPGNIDVNWETITTAQVNKFLAVSFSTLMIYDDDINFDITNETGQVTGVGPRTQFQHVLSVGFTYQFIGAKK